MPRPRKPEVAAKAILDMIEKKEARNAEDAVAKKPELAPGLDCLKAALAEGPVPSTPSPAAEPTKPSRTRPRATGSGPMRLTR